MSRVAFVSYSREDAARVETMKDRLTQLGFEVWLDKNLRGGQAWWDVILDRIRACEVFVMIISDASLQSHACAVERDYARALGKPIVPVAVAVTRRPKPGDIQTLQIIDYSAPTDEAAFALVRALNEHEPNPPLPDPLPEAPEPPLSYLNRQMDLVIGREALSHDEQVGILLTVRPGLRSGDADERVSAWHVLDALDARADVTREAFEEIRRLRGQYGSGSATVHPERRDSPAAKERQWGGDSPLVTWTKSAAGGSNTLASVGAVVAVGLLLSILIQLVSAGALNQAYENGLPDWAFDVQDALWLSDVPLVALLFLSFAAMVYVGMRHARGRTMSTPATAARVALGAGLRSIPLVLLWTGYAVVMLTGSEFAWLIAAMTAATTAGVLTQVLRAMGRDRRTASGPVRASDDPMDGM